MVRRARRWREILLDCNNNNPEVFNEMGALFDFKRDFRRNKKSKKKRYLHHRRVRMTQILFE